MFSLIIPCYNELENLKFHKNKFYNFVQNYKSNELIFVDNTDARLILNQAFQILGNRIA